MSAFVARWCVGSRVEATGGVFQVREHEPAPRSRQGCTGRREADKDIAAWPHLTAGGRALICPRYSNNIREGVLARRGIRCSGRKGFP